MQDKSRLPLRGSLLLRMDGCGCLNLFFGRTLPEGEIVGLAKGLNAGLNRTPTCTYSLHESVADFFLRLSRILLDITDDVIIKAIFFTVVSSGVLQGTSSVASTSSGLSPVAGGCSFWAPVTCRDCPASRKRWNHFLFLRQPDIEAIGQI